MFSKVILTIKRYLPKLHFEKKKKKKKKTENRKQTFYIISVYPTLVHLEHSNYIDWIMFG